MTALPVNMLWTIGHSTRPIDSFMALLRAHDIGQLVDVRTVPRSRHNPQFHTEPLAKRLADAEIVYRHAAALGGLRTPKKDSVNAGWRNASFRGYADYMQTEQFQRALEELLTYGTGTKSAIMCAEAVPWRCHRSLIADALVSRGWVVRHIMTDAKAERHRLTSFAVIGRHRVTYPSPHQSDVAPRLF